MPIFHHQKVNQLDKERFNTVKSYKILKTELDKADGPEKFKVFMAELVKPRVLPLVEDRDPDKEIIYDLLIKFEKLNGNIQQYSSIYLKYEQFKLEQEQKKQQQIGNNKTKKQFNSSETNGQNKKQPQKIMPFMLLELIWQQTLHWK